MSEPNEAQPQQPGEELAAVTETEAIDAPAITPDAALLASHDVALRALTEITGVQTIGALLAPEVHEARLITLFFGSLLPGYPGWRWAATLAKVSDDDPVTVLEVGLVPGDRSLVAPEWVPWAVRLASYREAQAQLALEEAQLVTQASDGLSDDDELDDEDDLLDNDFSGFDTELDGVDIDALDESAHDERDDYESGDSSEDDDDEDYDDNEFADEDDDDRDAVIAALDEEE